MISKKTQYGLKALLYLARCPGSSQIAEVAVAERIPVKFLQAILLALRNAGLLTSRMGKGGGYSLARNPGSITMGEVFRALEGSPVPLACLEGAAGATCPECDPAVCGVKMLMGDIWAVTRAILDTTTLADLSDRVERESICRQGVIDFTI